MKKEIKYTIEENVALAIKKIIGRISDTKFKGDYGLNEKEMELIHKLYSLIQDKDEED